MIRRLWPYVLGSVALGLDAYVIAGLLPVIASDMGSSAGAVGIGVAAFTAAYAICGPLLAGAAGRTASRSLLVALTVFALANLGSAFAPGIGTFIVTRLVAGAAAGVYSPLSSAVAASSVGAERKGRALALVLAGLACGTVFGVPLGLMLASALSWHWVFVMIALIGVLAALGIAFKGRHRIDNVAAPSFRERLSTLKRPANVVTMLVTLLTGVASLGLYTYFVPLMVGLGQDAHRSWLIWAWGIGGAVGALGVGHLVDSVRPRIMTAVITGLLSLTLAALGLNPPLVVVAVAVALWGLLGWSSLAPQQHTLMSSNPHDGATAVAANASANYLGSAIGSGLGALIVSFHVSGGALALWAAVPATGAFFLQILRTRMKAI